ncbi:MAG: hypothetical protein FJW22_03450 [Acidimicrobiia bacterium]|nr:hypothetical protein [Acidimicrobiia bacterium]
MLLTVVLLASYTLSYGQGRPVLSGASRGYTVEQWTADEGLPDQSLTELMIGGDGYLWVGSFVGLSRFDGVRFTPILLDLPSANVRTLMQGSDGPVWVGIVGDGLARHRDGMLSLFGAKDVGGNDVRSLAEDGAGRVWAGLEDGLAIVHNGVVTRMGPAR